MACGSCKNQPAIPRQRARQGPGGVCKRAESVVKVVQNFEKYDLARAIVLDQLANGRAKFFGMFPQVSCNALLLHLSAILR